MTAAMATTKLHYDGWLKLPTRLLRTLRVTTGRLIEIVPSDGGLLLRAMADKAASAEPELEAPAADAPAVANTPPPAAAAPRRKRAATHGAASDLVLPPAPRSAGRRKTRTTPSSSGELPST